MLRRQRQPAIFYGAADVAHRAAFAFEASSDGTN